MGKRSGETRAHVILSDASASPAAVADAAYDVGVQLAQLSGARLTDPRVLADDLTRDPAVLHGPTVNARLVDHFLGARSRCRGWAPT